METVAVLRRRWIAGDLTDQRFHETIDDLEDLDVARYPTLPLMRRAFELRSNVTTYDSTYIALAERLECTLLTADRRPATVPTITCPVEVLHP